MIFTVTYLITIVMVEIGLFFLFSKRPILDPIVKMHDGKWHCVKYDRISRDGGIILFLSLLIPYNPLTNFLYVLLALVFITGLLDDLYDLGMSIRLLVYFIVSGIFVYTFSFGVENLPIVEILFVLFIVIIINSFNIIDNMNGVCAGTFLIIAFFMLNNNLKGMGHPLLDIYLYLILIFCPIFLCFNFKNKIMLGNAGSTLLGFLIGIEAVHQLVLKEQLLTILLFLAYPLFDFCFVVIRRIGNGQAPWIGGSDHTSHILARRYGEKWAVGLIYLFQTICCFIGLKLP